MTTDFAFCPKCNCAFPTSHEASVITCPECGHSFPVQTELGPLGESPASSPDTVPLSGSTASSKSPGAALPTDAAALSADAAPPRLARIQLKKRSADETPPPIPEIVERSKVSEPAPDAAGAPATSAPPFEMPELTETPAPAISPAPLPLQVMPPSAASPEPAPRRSSKSGLGADHPNAATQRSMTAEQAVIRVTLPNAPVHEVTVKPPTNDYPVLPKEIDIPPKTSDPTQELKPITVRRQPQKVQEFTKLPETVKSSGIFSIAIIAGALMAMALLVTILQRCLR